LQSEKYPLKEYEKSNQVSQDNCAQCYCYEFIV